MTKINFDYVNNSFSTDLFNSEYQKNKVHLDEVKQALTKRQIQIDQKSAQMIDDDLGWLHMEEWANQQLVDDLLKQAKRVREQADVFVLIGVGGSNQAARAVIKAFQTEASPEVVYLGNNVSPHYINKVLDQLEGRSVYLNIIAKNFETLEPGIGFRVMRKFLFDQYGDAASERIFVTGTKGSYLEDLSKKHDYTFFSFPDNIGGRYSVFSIVGLFPIAVAGIDIKSLLQGGRDLQAELFEQPDQDHIALKYATYRNLLLKKGYDIEMLASFEPQFEYFSKWWIQLFAESEGKDDKGIFPVSVNYSEDLHSVGQYVQDGQKIIFETFLDVLKPNSDYIMKADQVADRFDYLDGKDLAEVNQDVFEATYQSHHQGGIPTAKLTISDLTPYGFGQLFYFFMFTCYLSGRILEVNPFNQPGVESYKRLMFEKLGKSN